MFGHDNQDDNNDNNGNNFEGQEQHDNIQAADNQQDTPHQPIAENNGFAASADEPAAIHAPAATDDLLDIKHEALQALTPLVGQLDQTPEEQFRTTMMMIQASDNHALVKVAYEAAKGITSEKERAQALLDIVNEINYFTQQNQT